MTARNAPRLIFGGLSALCVLQALAQPFVPSGSNAQARADSVLALMGFTVTPDVTTGSLSINDGTSANPDFRQTSFGGGFTVSKDTPLYLEGTAGYSRYDPTFVATDGAVQRQVPVKWNALSATGGVGWDFPIAHELVLRPIFNFTLGRVQSDSAIAANIIAGGGGGNSDLQFLANGVLNAYGLGGSVMLDYERYRPESEIDVELRYSAIHLQSFDSDRAVSGNADADSLSLWSRYRAPTGMTLLERPLRYVLEYAYTRFLGDLDGTLGFHSIHSFGVGLELDTGKYDMYVTRARLVLRVKRGDNVSGYGVGLAVSF